MAKRWTEVFGSCGFTWTEEAGLKLQSVQTDCAFKGGEGRAFQGEAFQGKSKIKQSKATPKATALTGPKADV